MIKKFTKLESGKHISAGVDAINELNDIQKRFEQDFERVAEIAKMADDFEMPNVDIISRVEVTEKIDQYTFAEDVREMTPYSSLENVIRTSYREVEVLRVENILVYTIMQDEFKAVGKADLNVFSYLDAVELAKSRAIVELEHLKQEKIACHTTMKRAKSFVVYEGGLK